jgi:hypothetical protein
VNENHTSQVAAAVHPTHQEGLLARIGRAQFTASVGAAEVAQEIERYGWHDLIFLYMRGEGFTRKRYLIARRHIFH